MAVDFSSLAAASTKAKDIATEQYVEGIKTDLESQIANVDVSTSISDNNDSFAQSQGFSDYTSMQTAYAALGKSIINGGYINAGLVSADSLVADVASIKKLLSQVITMDVTGEAKILSSDGSMEIDFKNGTIYIA